MSSFLEKLVFHVRWHISPNSVEAKMSSLLRRVVGLPGGYASRQSLPFTSVLCALTMLEFFGHSRSSLQLDGASSAPVDGLPTRSTLG